jgi:hypothetical protein
MTTTMTRMMTTSFLDLLLDGFGVLSLRAKWQKNGGMVEWPKFWNGGMAEIVEMAGMAERSAKILAWELNWDAKHGRMAEGMVEWQNG